MAEDEPGWDFSDIPAEEPEPEPTPEEVAAAAAASKKKDDKPKIDRSKLVKAPKPKYTLHWVRPLILGYKYLTEYRQFYYNDIIDWINHKSRGIYREEPQIEEWAERCFRMYRYKNENPSVKDTADLRWITGYRTVPQHYSYHTRAYYSLKYQPIL